MAKAKVLRTGYTDITTTDIWKYSVHSDYPTQKVALSGSTTGTILNGEMAVNESTTGCVVIPHNLGYIPFCKVSIGRTSTSWGGTRVIRVSGSQAFFDETDVLGRVYSATADATNLYVYINNTVDLQPGDRTWNIYYVILYDQT